MKLTYLVVVKQLTPTHHLMPEDREENPSGEHKIEAESEDEALDKFHSTIPIKCLDDFDIECVAKVAAEVEADIARMRGWISGGIIPPKENFFQAPWKAEHDETDMADIRNYELLAPDCMFTLDIVEAMEALHEGKKVQCSEWSDKEFIRLDEKEDLVDEGGIDIGGAVLVTNKDFNWRVV